MSDATHAIDIICREIKQNADLGKTGTIKIEFYKGGVSSLILEEMTAPDTFIRRKVIGLKKPR